MRDADGQPLEDQDLVEKSYYFLKIFQALGVIIMMGFVVL
jgi:hypothetical protein